MIKYELIRSKRKSLCIEIKPQGRIIVRAPSRMSLTEIGRFVEAKEKWILSHQKKMIEKENTSNPDLPDSISQEMLKELAEKAKDIIPSRVDFYAAKIGVTYGRITIRKQRTRWGSCSAKGNLNFNCLLMLAPPEVLDSVVVHELCHRKEMNHSKRFYDEVLRVFPEYRKCERWLKENGPVLLNRYRQSPSTKP